jgi:hypothetical protein
MKAALTTLILASALMCGAAALMLSSSMARASCIAHAPSGEYKPFVVTSMTVEPDGRKKYFGSGIDAIGVHLSGHCHFVQTSDPDGVSTKYYQPQ